MSSTIALLKIQYRQLRLTTTIILATIAVWIFLIIIIYPGDKGLQSLVEVFQRPEFQAVLGTYPIGENYYFGFWQLFGIYSLLPIAIFGIGLYYGAEITTREAAENTFDIGYSIPKSRATVLTTRLISSICIYLVLIYATGIATTVVSAILIKQIVNIETLIVLWLVMSVLGFVGIAIGMFIGTLYFDRGIAIQIAFFLIAFEFLLNTVINSGGDIDKATLDILKILSVQSYYNLSDILFMEKYDLIKAGFLTLGAVLLCILSIIFFTRRNLLETTYPPLYNYLSPIYWRKRRKIRKNNQNNGNTGESVNHIIETSREVPASRILIAWS